MTSTMLCGFYGGGAPGANRWVLRVRADVCFPVPAASAFGAVSPGDLHGRFVVRAVHLELRDVEQLLQIRRRLDPTSDRDFRIERFANELALARLFQLGQHAFAQR